jgi:exopolysaccharide biosynthesis WecB/TagA/CpsF family protein
MSMCGYYSPSFRTQINQCDFVFPDGQSLVWLARAKGLVAHRVCGPDLTLAVCAATQSHGARHYFYGGAEGIAERCAAELQKRFPGMVIAGTYSPPFRMLTDQEDEEVIQRINAANPDIVWVGLGCPKQEQWMASHRDRINCKVAIAIGAAFDIYAGAISRAPRWMQRSCLEWFYRLLQNPKRLWRRYLVYNTHFFWLLLTERFSTPNALPDSSDPSSTTGARVSVPQNLLTQTRIKMKLVESKTRVLVTGGGGFIGHHLVSRLKKEGYWVRSVDLKYPEYEPSAADDSRILDLREWKNCVAATEKIDQVYNLAADMGGIGYITSSHADIARNNSLINLHMLEASRVNGVRRYLYSSSACVYPQGKQLDPNVKPLAESDAIPADPEPGYGWEKLYAEQLCTYYREDYGLETRIVRFHNVYGPLGTYDGGKEKAPAAICRKVALANDGDQIEVWGDGNQTRSFMYIDDCVEGLLRLMHSPHHEPLNLGTDELVTINELVEMVSAIAGKRLVISHQLDKPQGVRGRNSDNHKILQLFGWQPSILLRQGLVSTYSWINQRVKDSHRARTAEVA